MSRPPDPPELPCPFAPVSNGEWRPPEPQARQRAAVDRYRAEVEGRARLARLTPSQARQDRIRAVSSRV